MARVGVSRVICQQSHGLRRHELRTPSTGHDGPSRRCVSGAGAHRRVGREGRHALPGILRGQNLQPAHTPGLRPGRDGFSGVVRGQTRCWRSRPCSRCMSPSGSSCSSRSALHRPSSCGSRLSAIGDRSGGSGEPREPDARPAARGEAGKTPVLAPEEARALLDSIEVATVVGLSDRALISLMAPAMRKPPGQCVSIERYPAGYLPRSRSGREVKSHASYHSIGAWVILASCPTSSHTLSLRASWQTCGQWRQSSQGCRCAMH